MASDTEQNEDVLEEGEEQERWSSVLSEVHEQAKAEGPWYRRVGIFLAWSAAIALSTGLLVTVALGVYDLFSPERLFGARALSDWLFWGAALLLFGGLVAPSAAEAGRVSERRRRDEQRFTGRRAAGAATSRASSTMRASSMDEQRDEAKPSFAERMEERRVRAVRRRLMGVYNPWRWRFWFSSLLCFGLSMLAGVLS